MFWSPKTTAADGGPPTSRQKCQFFVATITAENCAKVETAVAGLAAFLACNNATVASASTCDESQLIKLWRDKFWGNPDFPGRNISCSWQSLWCPAVVLQAHWSDSLCHLFCEDSTLPLIGRWGFWTVGGGWDLLTQTNKVNSVIQSNRPVWFSFKCFWLHTLQDIGANQENTLMLKLTGFIVLVLHGTFEGTN